ncbi:hypothetical protein ACHQM5_020188 [Ranunculus cassubicifolius]
MDSRLTYNTKGKTVVALGWSDASLSTVGYVIFDITRGVPATVLEWNHASLLIVHLLIKQRKSTLCRGKRSHLLQIRALQPLQCKAHRTWT